jgi:hypothetical protein
LPELTVFWWRDIPAQVKASDGEASSRVQLDERFEKAIDAAAMQAGLAGSDEYLAEWRRELRDCGPDLKQEAADEAARLEAAFPPEELRRLVRAGGRADSA